MEETLKLILEKIVSLDEGQKELRQDISTIKQDVSTLKEDVSKLKNDVSKIGVTLEHQIEPKISALFDARDISLQSDEFIMQGVKEVKEDISHLEKAVIRNTADIVDLKDYRKEN